MKFHSLEFTVKVLESRITADHGDYDEVSRTLSVILSHNPMVLKLER